MKNTLKSKTGNLITGVLLSAALLGGAMTIPARAVEKPAVVQQAAEVLQRRGVYQGDASGDLKLNNGLTRAELAAILTRLNDEVTDPSVFEVFCYFQDVPSWAKPYVGYTVSWLLMRGYDSVHFGPNDAVNPQMACTVVLRSCGYDGGEGTDWTYATAGQYAASQGWLDLSTAKASTITRGDIAVLLCRASGWLETAKQEQPPVPATTTPPAAAAQEAFEITADGKYIVHAHHWSREDFSQQANSAVFTGIFTRELYNAIRQTIVDGKAGDQPAFTVVTPENTTPVNRVLSYISSGVPSYDKYAPQNFPNHYEHPGYFAVSAYIPENLQAPLAFIQPIIEHTESYTSDREKVMYLNDYLCSLMAYDYENYSVKSAGLAKVFAPHTEELKGVCANYASNFKFLCHSVGIPCISIVSEEKDHIWNMVYADGQWLHVDVSANDTNSRDFILLTKEYPASGYNDSYPEMTAFLQELLVPGSSAN